MKPERGTGTWWKKGGNMWVLHTNAAILGKMFSGILYFLVLVLPLKRENIYFERELDQDKSGGGSERKFICVFGEFFCAKNNIWNIFCLWWQQKQQETCEMKPWLDVIWIWGMLLHPCSSRASSTCKHISSVSLSPQNTQLLILLDAFLAEKWQILTKSICSDVCVHC